MNDKTKCVLDVSKIKEVMVESMLNRYTESEVNKGDLNKFFKYLNHQSKENNSKSNLDVRINSIYKMIQKHYDDFIKLNQIIASLDQKIAKLSYDKARLSKLKLIQAKDCLKM